jgi:hypothetical protein
LLPSIVMVASLHHISHNIITILPLSVSRNTHSE